MAGWLAAQIFPFAVGAQACPIVSEIAAAPVGGNPEWIEIAEVSESAMRLTGFTLDDGVVRKSIDTSAVLAASGRLALSQDCAKLREQFGTGSIPCAEPSGWNRLSTESDRVVLRDPSGAVCDSVEWNRKTWGDWPSGRSLERIDPTRSGNDPANWVATSNPNGGTPGWVGDFVLEATGGRISAVVENRRVVPGAIAAAVALRAPWDLHLKAEVFDLARRKVATVFDGQIPSTGKVEWDGRSSGRLVAPGVYMLLLEFGTGGKDVRARLREWLLVGK